MGRLVLVARHIVVWLAQLSKRYGRSITRLDQIPDEALEELAQRGFTGLWLVGLWQRSPASRKIKELTGHPRADASAYAITAYETAAHLGGEAALETLRRRAATFGIRLAADMVPNHTGMDAPWIFDYPERYISTEEKPIGQYRFSGPNLSSSEEIELYLEDHYMDQSDAAVVFKRVDATTGETSYVYHGNDGVDTPWNDTAQLDFLREDVREAVIGQIVDLARRFPILRFDAAMTLTRHHFQRLWYPQIEDDGHIESRRNHGLKLEEFEAAFPGEFWRELVERVRVEAPHSLLLAETYWLTEGYFAYGLGINRVYNSAFMHSLAQEENAQFRQLVKDALAFDPRLLARFVNYMSTPDEESAVRQFGREEKYLGVCTLLATMPGLPLFAHGQVEGLEEKYAMDFARPRLEESPDAELIAQHASQIAPLLRRREAFADAAHFRLYDLFKADGTVQEDLIAFSNHAEGQRSLVVYNNSPDEVRGMIKEGVPFKVRGDLHQENLVEGLDLAGSEKWNVQELQSETEVHWNSDVLGKEGLAISLKGYQRQVFWNFEAAH